MLKSNIKINQNLTAHISNPPKFVVAKKQRTISEDISFSGIGLHTGNNVSMKLKPAPITTNQIRGLTKEESTLPFCLENLIKSL